MLKAFREPTQLRFAALPVIQRRLQGRCDQEGVGEPGEIAGNDDEAAIAAVLKRGEFHDRIGRTGRSAA
jgi:hypothetical protein